MPPVSAATANCALPSRKVTVPEGVPRGDVTVTVRVTESESMEGFSDDATELIAALAGFTVNVTLADAVV